MCSKTRARRFEEFNIDSLKKKLIFKNVTLNIDVPRVYTYANITRV